MKQITKIVQKIGNGGHIYLPKEMVGRKIAISLVEKSISDIEKEIFQILKAHLSHIQGIYLYGSYARGEQTPESDIDILAITDGRVKIKKRIGSYEITSMSLEQLQKTISYMGVLILPILREARPILNKELVERYKKEKLTKKNTKLYIETAESALNINKEWITEKDLKSMPAIVYSLIMRLKGLCLIESLVLDRRYSNKRIINILIKEGFLSDKARQIYRMYSEHRDDKNISKNLLDYDDISKLCKITYQYLKKAKALWEKLN